MKLYLEIQTVQLSNDRIQNALNARVSVSKALIEKWVYAKKEETCKQG
jgi:hypothetical protein